MAKMSLYACGIVGKRDGLILAEEEEERLLKQKNKYMGAYLYLIYINVLYMIYIHTGLCVCICIYMTIVRNFLNIKATCYPLIIIPC